MRLPNIVTDPLTAAEILRTIKTTKPRVLQDTRLAEEDPAVVRLSLSEIRSGRRK